MSTVKELSQGFRGRVKHTLRVQGLTQADLARHLGIKPSTVSSQLAYPEKLSLKRLFQIASYLQVTYQYLLSGETKPPKSTVTSEQFAESIDELRVNYGHHRFAKLVTPHLNYAEIINKIIKLSKTEAGIVNGYIDGLIEKKTDC